MLLIDITSNQPDLCDPKSEGVQHVELAVPCTYVLDMNSNLGKYRCSPKLPRCRRYDSRTTRESTTSSPLHNVYGWHLQLHAIIVTIWFFKTVSSSWHTSSRFYLYSVHGAPTGQRLIHFGSLGLFSNSRNISITGGTFNACLYTHPFEWGRSHVACANSMSLIAPCTSRNPFRRE